MGIVTHSDEVLAVGRVIGAQVRQMLAAEQKGSGLELASPAYRSIRHGEEMICSMPARSVEGATVQAMHLIGLFDALNADAEALQDGRGGKAEADRILSDLALMRCAAASIFGVLQRASSVDLTDFGGAYYLPPPAAEPQEKAA